jgi:hypothetical protein
MPRGDQNKPFASYNPDHEDSSSSDEEDYDDKDQKQPSKRQHEQQQQQQPSKRKRELKASRSNKQPNIHPDGDDDVHVSLAATASQNRNPAAAYSKELQDHKEQLAKQARRLEKQARRQAAAAAQAAAPPAVAAALPPQPPELDPLLETLLQHFRHLYSHSTDGDEEIPHVDLAKARNVLEATAGNVPMAVQLYWDDHFATAAAQASALKKQLLEQEEGQQQQQQKNDKHDAESGDDHGGNDDHDGGDDEEEEGDDDDDDGLPHRRVRRSLDRDFGRAADQPADDDDEDDDDMEDEDEGDDKEDDDENAVAAREQQQRQQNQQNQEQQLIVDALAGQQAQRLLRVEMGESVSVSDDEGGTGVWGIVGRMVGQLEDEEASPPIPPRRRLNHPSNNSVVRRVQEAAVAVTKKVLPQRSPVEEETTAKKRKPLEPQDEDADDYISDSDWLEDEAASTLPAFDFLWGKGEPTSTSSASSASSLANEHGGGAEGNVIADEDDQEESSSGSGIPHTWLNASFSLSSCSTGLAAKPPKAEDVELFVWRQQQNGSDRNGRNALPPPHHCKAVTALLSIVTAMLYTGASIQGDEVNCTSAKKPFAELSEEERKRQFESRLADALSALIFVAAKASQDRKKRALRKALAAKGSDVIKTQTMQRKLRLIPTCCWEDEVASGLPRPPGGPLYQPVQLTTSYTNIGDIRVYVLSSMRHFTARGGVALLLETILRIHGKGVLARMVHKARKEANLPDDTKSLIACTCEERQKKVQEDKPLPPSERNDTTKLMDMTPDGTECMSVELLSLILTGKMYSNLKGWSAQGLSFGILTNHPGQVGWQLARPEKPVWILQGETCYSVLLLESSKGTPATCNISKLDRPGAVLQLTHWNCWYEQRNKSGLRLTTAAAKWKPPMANKLRAAVDLNKPKHMSEILLERRQQQRTNIVSADEHETNEEQDRESRSTLEEIERCTPNPDDKRFYADKYRMWQFDMGRSIQEDDAMEEDAKPRAEQWVPYHRLTDRQKLLVEMKLGPKINTILWTRWPKAAIDNFTPGDGPLPIV